MKGTKQGEVHAVYNDRLDDLQHVADVIATAFTGAGTRVWMIPPSLAERDLLSVNTLHNPAWERDSINVNYVAAMSDPSSPGTVGDIVSLKMQADYNACEERAFRLRHSTIVRAHVHAHGRRAAHGMVGGVFSNMQRQSTNIIRAGALKDEDQILSQIQ